jgi:hypothetical protein
VEIKSEEKIFLDINSNTSSLEGAYTSVTLLLVLVDTLHYVANTSSINTSCYLVVAIEAKFLILCSG